MHLAAVRLNAALAGRRLIRSDFRTPALATSDLSGQTVLEVAARGKHMLLRTDAALTLHTHFRMDGSWHLYPRGGRWHGPSHQARVVLEVPRRMAVGFRLAIVELLPTKQEREVVGHLGPDVLGPDWDPGEVLRRLLLMPERAVGESLIDQRLMAGPGNVYKSEACFLRGIHPWTPVGGVTDLPAVVDLMKRLMEANRSNGTQITTGDTRPGRQRWVYGRAGQECRRCGTPIRSAVQGDELSGRLTYWCPSCQPAGGSGMPRP